MIKIIGGGPVGCHLAANLAKKKDVTIFEENKKIGTPVQCTGILTHTINNVLKVNTNWVENKIYQTRIFAPNKKTIEINFKKPNIIINRKLFDEHLEQKAIDEGVKIFYEHKFVKPFVVKNLKTKKEEKIKFEKLIGADGPRSTVRKAIGLNPITCLSGIQAIIKQKNNNCIDFYPYIGEYAWAVPESENILRVGIAARRDAGKIFRDFKKKYPGKIISWQSGVIPLHNPRTQTENKNIYFVGDSAGQIKNTTGGGIIPGLIAAEKLSEAIIQNKNYTKLWKKKIGKELWLHYQIRRVMNNFSQKDWNKLIETFNKDPIKKVLSEKSRDEPIGLITKLILKEPKLLLYIRRFWK